MIRFFYFMFFVFILSLNMVNASIQYALDDFEKKGLYSNFGMVFVDGDSFLKAGLSPNLVFGLLDFGVDLNLYIPLGDYHATDKNLDILSIRYLGVNYKDKHGIKWGHLRNVTLGSGLLMDQYDTGSFGGSEFSMKKGGVLGFASAFGARADVLVSAREWLRAGRLSYTFKNTPLVLPVRVGGTVVQDIEDIGNSNFNQRPKQTGYSFDVSLPFAGDLLTAYIEYAELIDQGKGASVGVRGLFSEVVGYRAEYRTLGKGFVPGYFGSDYELTPFDFATDAPSKSLSGFLASADLSLMGGYMKLGAMAEFYGDKKLGSAAFGWQQFRNTVGVINYRIPFQGKKFQEIRSDVLYLTGGLFDYVVHFKRLYKASGTYEDFYAFSVRVNLDSLIPGVSF